MTEMGRLAWSDPEKAKTMTSRIPLGNFAGQNLQNSQFVMCTCKVMCTQTHTLRCVCVCVSAEVEDVVNTILFLLSDKSKMTNGVTLPVDGGFLAC